MHERHFAYGPRPLTTAGAGMVCLGAGCLFAYIAASGTPMRLFPLPFYVSGAPVLVFAALAFFGAAVFVAALLTTKVHGPRSLVVTEEWIELPRAPLRRATVRVHRREVRSATAFSAGGTHGIQLFTAAGKVSVSNRFVGEDGVAAVKAWLRSDA